MVMTPGCITSSRMFLKGILRGIEKNIYSFGRIVFRFLIMITFLFAYIIFLKTNEKTRNENFIMDKLVSFKFKSKLTIFQMSNLNA